MEIKVTVPATSANIGPGYDILGIALKRYNTFRFTPAATSSKTVCHFTFSEFVKTTTPPATLDHLTKSEDNLIIDAIGKCMKKCGLQDFPLVISCQIDIPLSRGLGSSSTAILAGVLAGNEFALAAGRKALNADELFALAVDLEGHPDNIAPAFYGGFILSLKQRDGRTSTTRLNISAPVKLAGIVPHQGLATARAREVVPATVDSSVVAFQSSRCALLTHLLSLSEFSETDRESFALALDDQMHQQQRADLIPGMNATFSYYRKLGALGTYLSGAGTTLLAFWPADFDFSGKDLGKAMKKSGIENSPIFPEIDPAGAKVELLN